MSQVSQILPKDLVKAIMKFGFFKLRQRGSHLRLVHSDGRKITIALRFKPMPKGTLYSILRQAKISKKELRKVL